MKLNIYRRQWVPKGVTGNQPAEVSDKKFSTSLRLRRGLSYFERLTKYKEVCIMGSNKNLVIKQAKVKELVEKFEKAEAAILTSYSGITVEQDTQLRKKMREAGVEYKVIKNTLTSRAVKELGFDLDEYLEGPVAVAFSNEDPTAPARILAEFAEKNKAIELKAGIVQGKMFDTAKVVELSKVPPKEVLIAKLLGSMKAPVSNFVYLINAIKEKKEETNA